MQSTIDYFKQHALSHTTFVVVTTHIETDSGNWHVGCPGLFLDENRILFDSEDMSGIGNILPVYDAAQWLREHTGKYWNQTVPMTPKPDAIGAISPNDGNWAVSPPEVVINGHRYVRADADPSGG